MVKYNEDVSSSIFDAEYKSSILEYASPLTDRFYCALTKTLLQRNFHFSITGTDNTLFTNTVTFERLDMLIFGFTVNFLLSSLNK
jgi:hypothetical protein